MEKIEEYDKSKQQEYAAAVARHMVGNPVYDPSGTMDATSYSISATAPSVAGTDGAAMPPEDIFRKTSLNFSKFDARGLPTHHGDGQPVSAKFTKKMLRKQRKYIQKHFPQRYDEFEALGGQASSWDGAGVSKADADAGLAPALKRARRESGPRRGCTSQVVPLRNRNVAIFGAASPTGQAVAHCCVESGARVAVIDPQVSTGRHVVQALLDIAKQTWSDDAGDAGDAGTACHFYVCNMRGTDGVVFNVVDRVRKWMARASTSSTGPWSRGVDSVVVTMRDLDGKSTTATGNAPPSDSSASVLRRFSSLVVAACKAQLLAGDPSTVTRPLALVLVGPSLANGGDQITLQQVRDHLLDLAKTQSSDGVPCVSSHHRPLRISVVLPKTPTELNAAGISLETDELASLVATAACSVAAGQQVPSDAAKVITVATS